MQRELTERTTFSVVHRYFYCHFIEPHFRNMLCSPYYFTLKSLHLNLFCRSIFELDIYIYINKNFAIIWFQECFAELPSDIWANIRTLNAYLRSNPGSSVKRVSRWNAGAGMLPHLMILINTFKQIVSIAHDRVIGNIYRRLNNTWRKMSYLHLTIA